MFGLPLTHIQVSTLITQISSLKFISQYLTTLTQISIKLITHSHARLAEDFQSYFKFKNPHFYHSLGPT